MRILFIGDIVGKPGYGVVTRAVPGLRLREQLDLVVANAENAADGSGLTPQIYRKLIGSGIDCLTMGDHIYRRREIFTTLEAESNIVKPANFPKDSPGRCWTVVPAANGCNAAIFSLLGRVFMRPVDCPWTAASRVLDELPSGVPVRLLDFHAEATSDKQVMGRYLDGRVSAVLGTHTHVTTADETVLPAGTAFQCDVGMSGPHESIIGRKIDRVLETTITFRPTHFQVATDDVRMSGTIIDVDNDTGKALGIRRISVNEEEADTLALLVTREGTSSTGKK